MKLTIFDPNNIKLLEKSANTPKQSLKYVYLKLNTMPDFKEVERKIREMLIDMGDEQLLSDLEESFRLSDERDQKISNALEEMMAEVDVLLLRMDELELEALEIEDDDLIIR